MCSVVSIQLRKNALNSLLHGVLRYGELIRNLLVRVAGGDEAQHDDFCCVRARSLTCWATWNESSGELAGLGDREHPGWRGSIFDSPGRVQILGQTCVVIISGAPGSALAVCFE